MKKTKILVIRFKQIGDAILSSVICKNLKERKNPFKYLKKVWEVTREDYDIVIDIMSTPKSEFFLSLEIIIFLYHTL